MVVTEIGSRALQQTWSLEKLQWSPEELQWNLEGHQWSLEETLLQGRQFGLWGPVVLSGAQLSWAQMSGAQLPKTCPEQKNYPKAVSILTFVVLERAWM